MSRKLPPLPDGYVPLTEEIASYNVAIHERVKKRLGKARPEQRAGLEALIRDYSEGGPSALPFSKFNADEGWFPGKRAPNKIRLEAFKPWQLRAYGFCREYAGSPWFFITGVDVSKKQDGGDQDIIEAAGKEAARLNKEIEGNLR